MVWLYKMKKLIISTTLILASTAAIAGSEWGYDEQKGPDKWSSLHKDYELCSTGKFQSPFDITGDLKAGLEAKNFNYGETTYKVSNTGHGIKITPEVGNYFEVEGHKFELLQFHFHTPSEYTINGKQSPMVVHLVHMNEENELGVIGVMYEEGESNILIEKVWSNIPSEIGGENNAKGMIDLNDLLPDNKTYYRFSGSLTTPPCSEGVNWFFMKDSISASKDQIDAHTSIYPNNARTLQEKGNRIVVEGK